MSTEIEICRQVADKVIEVWIESGERFKTIEVVERICAAAHAGDLGRDAIFLSIGGGVCSDVTTMAASIFRRGVDQVRIPTTLLAQVDAAVGLKSAVNFGGKKNSLGTFHPATAVLINPEYLESLDEVELRQGASEILKVGMAADVELVRALTSGWRDLAFARFGNSAGRSILEAAIMPMIAEFEMNPFEVGVVRRAMDAGHTFSPLLEAASDFALKHGDAVAIDLRLCAQISRILGTMSNDDCEQVDGAFRAIGLPISSRLLDVDLCVSAIEMARANRKGVNLPLFDGLGKCRFSDGSELSSSLFREAVKSVRRTG